MVDRACAVGRGHVEEVNIDKISVKEGSQDEADRNYYKGAAYFARALAYDKLARRFCKAYDKDYIQRSFAYVGGLMTTIYTDIDTDWGNLSGAMLSSATDESEYSHDGNAVEDFYNGNWSPTNNRSSI